jgi:dienelactone hydrolase
MGLLKTSLFVVLSCAVIFPQSILARDKLMDHALKFPDGDGPFPTVLLLHTAGGFKDVTDNIQRYLNMGYAVAAPDYFEPFGLDNSNRFDAFKKRRKDIEKLLKQFVAYVEKQPKVDTRRLFAVGFSAGGFFSAYLACEQLVKAGVAHYGVWNFPGQRNDKFSNFGAKKYPTQYFDKKCAPFYAFHGDKDITQRPKYVQKAFDYIGNTKNDFRVHWYEGAGHKYDVLAITPDSFGADALRRTDEFLRSLPAQ